jgi:hypothetical protein
MTKVIMTISETTGIMYDCLHHAGEDEACVIMSTLSNVLVEACFNSDHEPTVYEPGHVRIDLPPGTGCEATFLAVKGVIEQAVKQYPDAIKMY